MPVLTVLQHLWDRVTGTQPAPPDWVVAVSGAVALIVVLNGWFWHLTRNAITIAHEGGHALVSLLAGRRLQGIRLHSDTSGETRSRGRPDGPGLVLTTMAGYLTPPLLGAGAAWPAGRASRGPAAVAAAGAARRDAAGDPQRLRRAGGAGHGGGRGRGDAGWRRRWCRRPSGTRRPGSCCSAGCGRWSSCSGPAAARGGPGSRGPARRRRLAGPRPESDADQLAGLTGVPGGVWVGLFLLVALAALALGAWLLVPGPLPVPRFR